MKAGRLLKEMLDPDNRGNFLPRLEEETWDFDDLDLDFSDEEPGADLAGTDLELDDDRDW